MNDDEYSLFMALETWLLLRIMCGTKFLNVCSDYTRPVRHFRSARVYLSLLFMGQIRGKGVANAADIHWRKMQWRICAKWRQWQS